jgi:hypothetical protein
MLLISRITELVSRRKYNTVHSRFSESRFFECPFSPSSCAVVQVVSMLDTEFSCSAYLCVHTCVSGITVLPLQQRNGYNFNSKIIFKTNLGL